MDEPFTYSSPIILGAAGRRQFVFWSPQGVTSLDPRTGKTWWRVPFTTPGDMAVSTPVHSGDRLPVAGTPLRLGQDQPSVEVLWPESKAPLKRVPSNTSTALFQDEFIYSARISGELVCLEAATGRGLWKTNGITQPGNGSSPHLTPDGDGVWIFTDRGDLIRAQPTPQSCRELGRAHLSEPTSPFGQKKCAWTPPAFANRHLYARNDTEVVRVSLASAP